MQSSQNIKADIVVLCFNGLEACTRPCVESIFKHTPAGKYRLILVDNKSSDGTEGYITSLAKAHEHVTAICNDENLGYAAGNNRGIEAGVNPYIILLNNDTIVTKGWLGSLLEPFAQDATVAMVGPVTNSAGGQQMLHLPNIDKEGWELVAAAYVSSHLQVTRECRNLGFFCVAIRKSALERVGVLDEEYGLGMFEDDDLCLRVRNAGYKLVMTDACFVKHLGSFSFSKLGQKEKHILYESNRELFASKHKQNWTYANFIADIWSCLRGDIERSFGLMRQAQSMPDLPRVETLKHALIAEVLLEEELQQRLEALRGNTEVE